MPFIINDFPLRGVGGRERRSGSVKCTKSQISVPVEAPKTDLSSDTRMERSSNVYEKFK